MAVEGNQSVCFSLFENEESIMNGVVPDINSAINLFGNPKSDFKDFVRLRIYIPPSITVNGEYEEARKELVKTIDAYNSRVEVRKYLESKI